MSATVTVLHPLETCADCGQRTKLCSCAHNRAIAEAMAGKTSDTPEGLAAAVLGLKDLIDERRSAWMFSNALLFKMVGEEMLAKGQRVKVIGEFKFHCEPPADLEWCMCHATRPNECPTPHHERQVFVRKASRPDFWVSRIKRAAKEAV